MSEFERIRGADIDEYDYFHRTLEVQVFPQDLRATWDDTGCSLCIFVVFVAAASGMFLCGFYYKWTKNNVVAVQLSETWARIEETLLLIGLLFSSCVMLGFILMCLCGLNMQLMAAKKRRFGSLRKNRVLLSLMHGQSAWDEPEFQHRLRQQDRRLDRIKETVEARMENWLAQREARCKYMQSMRLELAKMRNANEWKSAKPAVGCVLL